MLCAGSGQRIIRPIFFNDIVNLELYVNNIFELFFEVLTEEEKQYVYFQQDSATAHTLQQSVEALREIFDERIISQGLWLPHLLDLNV
jgi:hypothetical protein